jgi:tetratricopeptide (TPR) repeat protein
MADADDPTDLAAELHARGERALADGALQEADDLAGRAAALFASADPEHPDVANALLLRARIAHARSDFGRDLELAEQAAAIIEAARRAWPDEDVVARLHAHVAAEVASALIALGRYDDAERILAAELGEIEVPLGADAAEIGELCNLLGIVHKYQARYDEAAACYARAVELARRHHGDDSALMASLEHNLGGLGHARGELARAEPHARRAVELREAALGPDHPAVASDLAAWAAILDEQGRTAEAEAALGRALAIFERAHGELHFEVGYTLGSLGALHAGGERWDAAGPVLERARRILVGVLGDQHVEVARVDQYLAVVAHGRGDRPAALAHAERALAICARAFPPDHPRTVDARTTRDAIAGI